MIDNERNEEILKQAFKEHMTEKLQGDFYREDEFETSKSFDKKMTKLIKSQRNVYHRVTLTRARKALVAAAIIIAILMSSLSVGAVREMIGSFFVTHFSGYDRLEIKTSPDDPTALEDIYLPKYIPKGYKITFEDDLTVVNMNNLVNFYENKKGRFMAYMQHTHHSFSNIQYDNENSDIYTEVRNGVKYMVHVSHSHDSPYLKRTPKDMYSIVWDDGKYVFSLTLEFEDETQCMKELYKMADSLEIKGHAILSD